MPKIETWDNLPAAVRQHLTERMRDRSISITDLNQLRLWIQSQPDVPDGDWYKDFGSFKICGRGPYPKTFLLRGQAAKGSSI
jgi:hypothetical protein